MSMRSRRLPLANLLIVAGALVLLTPVAFILYDEALYRLEMGRVPQPSPVLLTPVGETAPPPALPPSPPPPAPPPPAPVAVPEPEEPAALSESPADLPVVQIDRTEGIPTYQIEIPKLGLSYLVGEGIDDPVLAQGPGHYPQTALPGEAGTAAVAGHRTIRGKPAFFYSIDKLQPGDEIRIGYRDRSLTFEVQAVYLTSPYDLSVLDPTTYPSLTLTTCDPPGSDEKRLIVTSRLKRSTEANP